MSSDRDESPTQHHEFDPSVWSLASTANDLVLEHGRRYPSRNFGSNPFPRGDDLALRNEVALHNLMLHLFDNKLYVAPIEHPKNILDVRCGVDGLWAKNMADTFPDAQVTGIDILTQKPHVHENLQFVVQSFNDYPWILDEVTQIYGQFDFIYARALFAGSRDYPTFYKQCLEHLEPGGYLEQTEVVPECMNDDGVCSDDSIVKQVMQLRPEIEKHMQTDYALGFSMKRLIEAAGFIEVEERVDYLPCSAWPNATSEPKRHRLGDLMRLYYETGLQGWILQPCVQHLKFSVEEVNTICQAAFLELQENMYHYYVPCITVTARKPETMDTS